MKSRYRPKERNGAPARFLREPLRGGPARRLAEARENAAKPFVGITAEGTPERGLFTLANPGLGFALDTLAAAARGWLNSLEPEQREAARFVVDAPEWRLWCNIHPFLVRHGQLLESLDGQGREAGLALAREALSPAGFQTVRDVMRLNETVRELTGKDEEYGEWLYWLSLFGEPSASGPWGFQLDGHHLNLSVLALGGQLVLTPTFLGSEPVEADAGAYAGTRVFAKEEALGLALMRALPATLQRQATVGQELPDDVLGTAFRDNLVLGYAGVRFADMPGDAQALARRLMAVYIGRAREPHASAWQKQAEAHLGQTWFAWMGGIGDADAFYYRLHNPVLLIEFDHQDGLVLESDGPSRHHIHTLVRTPNGNDYGTDLLRQHRERFPHPH
ncbi:MAG: DUF3500 domain-containing protein [Chloroflexota bacterium]